MLQKTAHFEKFSSIARTLLNVALFVICCFYGFRLFQYHLKIISNENLIEYRSAAMIVASDLMASGESPYDAEHQPIYSNNYGALYPILGVPLIYFFGPELPPFRIIAGVFLWLTLALVAIVLIRKKVPALYVFAGVVTLYAVLLYSITPLERPDSLGLFLFMGGIFIPYLYHYSTKSLVVSAFMAVLAFYAKPYFILAAPLLGLCLLLMGFWKKGIIYGVVTASLFIISFVIIKSSQEFYFYDALNINITTATNSREFCLSQLSTFFNLNRGMIFILILAGMYILYTILIRKENLAAVGYKDLYLPGSCLILTSLFVYFKMGGHTGAYMYYLFHLMSPFLVITTLLLTRSVKDLLVFRILITLLLTFNVYKTFAFLPGFNCENKNEWAELETLVKEHDHIFASPVLSVVLLRNNKQIYDSGLTEYFHHIGHDEGIRTVFYNDEEKRRKLYFDFKNEINKDVSESNFDLIVFARGLERVVNKDTLNEKYQVEKTIRLCLPHSMQTWDLDVYTPRIQH